MATLWQLVIKGLHRKVEPPIASPKGRTPTVAKVTIKGGLRRG